MSTPEKVAYLKGLAEGMQLDAESKEGRLISVIIDILEDMAADIEDLEDNALDLSEEIDELSDDLAELEEYCYDEEYDDEDDEDDYCGKGRRHHMRCRGDEDGEPVFYDANGYSQLSDTALYFIGGLLKHAPALCAFTNPGSSSLPRPSYASP